MKERIFLQPAEEEMLEAAQYYEEQSRGLGGAFLEEIEHTITSIVTHPQSGRKLSNNIQRRIARRFPFGVLYAVEPDAIVIVAIMHLHRRPGYWKDRL